MESSSLMALFVLVYYIQVPIPVASQNFQQHFTYEEYQVAPSFQYRTAFAVPGAIQAAVPAAVPAAISYQNPFAYGGQMHIGGYGAGMGIEGFLRQMAPVAMAPPLVIPPSKPPCYCTPRICNKCFIAAGVPTQVIDNRGDTTIATSGSGITVQTNCDPQQSCLAAPQCRPCQPGDTRYESCIYFGPGVNACTLGRAGFFGKK